MHDDVARIQAFAIATAGQAAQELTDAFNRSVLSREMITQSALGPSLLELLYVPYCIGRAWDEWADSFVENHPR